MNRTMASLRVFAAIGYLILFAFVAVQTLKLRALASNRTTKMAKIDRSDFDATLASLTKDLVIYFLEKGFPPDAVEMYRKVRLYRAIGRLNADIRPFIVPPHEHARRKASSLLNSA